MYHLKNISYFKAIIITKRIASYSVIKPCKSRMFVAPESECNVISIQFRLIDTHSFKIPFDLPK